MDVMGNVELDSTIIDYLIVENNRLSALKRIFPEVGRNRSLSRGPLYYSPKSLIEESCFLMEQLESSRVRDVMTCEKRRDIFVAVAENVENVLLSAANAANDIALEEASERQTQFVNFRRLLLDAATYYFSLQILWKSGVKAFPGEISIGEIAAALRSVGAEQVPFRQFRELDHRNKIISENEIIWKSILPKRSFDLVVCPLYGSIRMGTALTAYQRLMASERSVAVMFLRIGFHDQGGVGYFNDDGRFRLEAVLPSSEIEAFADGCRGKNVLVVDDNIGYGTTAHSVRELILSVGGTPSVRCCETAWQIFERDATHDLSEIIEFPSLRGNFHHSKQVDLIGGLSQSGVAYLDNLSNMSDDSSHAALVRNLELALKVPSWSPDQIEWLREEQGILRSLAGLS